MQKLVYRKIITLITTISLIISNIILLSENLNNTVQYLSITTVANIVYIIIYITFMNLDIEVIKKGKIHLKPVIITYINIYISIVIILILVQLYTKANFLYEIPNIYTNILKKYRATNLIQPEIIYILDKIHYNHLSNLFLITIISMVFLIPIFTLSYFITNFFNKLKKFLHKIQIIPRQKNIKLIPTKNIKTQENQQLVSVINEILQGLQDSRKEITLSQRSLAWFDITRTIRHEINNPLTPIRLILSNIKNDFAPNISHNQKLFLEYLDIAEDNITKITNLLRHYSNHGILTTIELSYVNIFKIINKNISNQQIINPHIQYSIKCQSKDRSIYCDSVQITQVFINLIKNAEEALVNTPNGHIQISIQYSFNEVKIQLQDNGPGFYDINMLKNNETYTTKRINKGIGIGLASSYQIIKNHHGSIYIDNQYSYKDQITGALIKIHLPLNKLHEIFLSQNIKTKHLKSMLDSNINPDLDKIY